MVQEHGVGLEWAWSCTSETACECYPKPIEEAPSEDSAYALRQSFQNTLARNTRMEECLRLWTVLELYTNRKLSFITDRLSAISGLAELIQEKMNCEYICGM